MIKSYSIMATVHDNDYERFIEFLDEYNLRNNIWYQRACEGGLVYELFIIDSAVAVLCKMMWGGK